VHTERTLLVNDDEKTKDVDPRLDWQGTGLIAVVLLVELMLQFADATERTVTLAFHNRNASEGSVTLALQIIGAFRFEPQRQVKTGNNARVVGLCGAVCVKLLQQVVDVLLRLLLLSGCGAAQLLF